MTASLYDFSLDTIEGKSVSLQDYRGKVLLIVNVASKCGLTPQYSALESLYENKRAAGLEILGFPANDFRGQEPGSDAEIASFCQTQYQVQFPLFSKISVVGEQQHPLYRFLTQARPESSGEGPFRERLASKGVETTQAPDVLWNFEKFLVARNGEVVGRFSPDVSADDPRLLAALDAELARAV